MLPHETVIIHSNHMDLIWKRPWVDYIEIQCDVINKALDLMDRYSEFHFFIEQTAVLESYLDWYPKKKEILDRRIAEGRLEIIGGVYALIDLNMPLGECLIRNYLVGRKYLEKMFKIRAAVGCLADSFGQCSQIPQIMAAFGLKYTFPGRHTGESNKAGPKDLPFIWIGADGSSIVSGFRDAGAPFGYYEPMNTQWVIDKVHKNLEEVSRQTPLSACWITSEEVLPRRNVFMGIKDLTARLPNVKLRFGRLEDYYNRFDDLVSSGEINVKEITGEFNPLFTACYTGRSLVKQANTRLQNKLISVEALLSCLIAAGRFLDSHILEHAWKLLLINQCHDSLAGCVSFSAYRDIMNRFEKIDEEIDRVLTDLSAIEYNPIQKAKNFFFNSLPYEWSGILEMKNERGLLCVNGTVPEQVIVGDFLYARIPPVAAFSSAEFHWDTSRKAPEMKDNEGTTIKNEYYRVMLKHNSLFRIERLEDTGSPLQGAMVLEGMIGNLVIREDRGGFWTSQPTGLVYMAEEPAEFHIDSGGPLEHIVSGGEIKNIPWNKDIRCHWKREVRLWNGEDRIDFVYHIDWEGKGCDLSVMVPLPFKTEEAKYETPFAVWKRPSYEPVNQPFGENRGGEWPSLRFVSVDNNASEEKRWGVSVVHQGCHGIIFKNDALIINLLHSPDENNFECGAVCWDRVPVDGIIPEPSAEERGAHEFIFSIRIHRGDWIDGNILRLTETLHHPLIETRAPIPTLDLRINAPGNIGYSTLKPAENNQGIVLRLWEGGGKHTHCQFFYPQCKGAYLSGMDEEKRIPLIQTEGGYNLEFKPYEVKTVFFTSHNPPPINAGAARPR